MGIRFIAVFFCFFLITNVVKAESKAETKVEILLSLHKAEPYGATIFHNDLLWVGQSRTAVPYTLSVYGDDGAKLITQAKLPHSVSYVYPHGANTVLVMGKTFIEGEGWKTYYSLVTYQARSRRLSVTKTYKFGMKFQVDQFGGDAKQMFFSNPGDREVLTMGFWGPKRLNHQEVFGPGEMTLLGDTLFIVERPGPGFGNVVKLNLKTGSLERVFKGAVNSSLRHTTLLPSLGKVVLAASQADTLVLIDAKGNRADGDDVRQVKLAGSPQGMAVFGSCLAVLRQSDRKISFLKLNDKDLAQTAEVDISSGGYELSNPIYLAVNPATKTLFVRSIAPCLVCEQSQASVARVTVDEAIKKACQ